MILLFFILISQADGRFVNSPIAHLSDTLRLKCDALPYRTAYIDTRCYFAVAREVKFGEAAAQCSSIFPGSQMVSNVANNVFTAMMVDKSKYHTGSSGDIKHTICVYENIYKCDAGEQSPIFPGKCILRDEKQRIYKDAVTFCESNGMEVPAVANQLENRMVRGAVHKNQVFLRNDYYGTTTRKWARAKYFSHWSTCEYVVPGLAPGWCYFGEICRRKSSAVMDKNGLWGAVYDWPTPEFLRDTVCVKDAYNEFTQKSSCIAFHEFNKTTGLCEWTGPTDGCLAATDIHNKTTFFYIKNFPTVTFSNNGIYGTEIDEIITKVVVRRGCLFSGWTQYWETEREILSPLDNLVYGEYKVPSYYTGDLKEPADGLSGLRCLCDPTEANLNGHVPAPPADRKCAEYHKFDESTQQCEWIHDPKYCAEVRTSEGRKQFIEMPKYPAFKKYDADHYLDSVKRAENFHRTINEIVIRQHCWLVTVKGSLLSFHGFEQGYGKHFCHPGTERIMCECIH